ncbi:hypothetical protein HHI36_000342 [Cryptolaemus montrouzieri]|uniref:Uncharacterized protein n=1 Tax=Cryptolaemus montrouzieri TaxID=559131 RepID=A0ABD2P4F2_9CUCU
MSQIDQDILTSKQLIEEYQNHTLEMHNIIHDENLQLDKKQDISAETSTDKKDKKKYTQAEINKEVAIISDNGQPDINSGLFLENPTPTSSTKGWPTFPDDISKVNFVNTAISPNMIDQTRSSNPISSTTKAYPKYFSYHRVTGKPVFINKNPKAYVAVSVVAPKTQPVHSNEDLELEHELRQLKPWTHSQNLKNMESIRSRWVIDSERHKKAS